MSMGYYRRHANSLGGNRVRKIVAAFGWGVKRSTASCLQVNDAGCQGTNEKTKGRPLLKGCPKLLR